MAKLIIDLIYGFHSKSGFVFRIFIWLEQSTVSKFILGVAEEYGGNPLSSLFHLPSKDVAAALTVKQTLYMMLPPPFFLPCLYNLKPL